MILARTGRIIGERLLLLWQNANDPGVVGILIVLDEARLAVQVQSLN